jgi:uncharacterized glyoxalase superfamily protein PhnB
VTRSRPTPASTTTERAPSGASFSRTTSAPARKWTVVDAARSAGAEVTKVPSETSYGGYAGFFRDPDGHVWEVAHNPGFTLNRDGTLTLPDFGDAT